MVGRPWSVSRGSVDRDHQVEPWSSRRMVYLRKTFIWILLFCQWSSLSNIFLKFIIFLVSFFSILRIFKLNFIEKKIEKSLVGRPWSVSRGSVDRDHQGEPWSSRGMVYLRKIFIWILLFCQWSSHSNIFLNFIIFLVSLFFNLKNFQARFYREKRSKSPWSAGHGR